MRRFTDHLIVFVYVVLAAAPLLAIGLHIKGRTLFGALPPTPRPELKLDPVLSEQYQKEFTSWFESRLRFRGTSVAFDNALLYYVFRETRVGSQVRLGKDGVLFHEDDISFFNKNGAPLPTLEFIDKIAGQIAQAQRRLAARHRAFVPIIIPSKSTIWRDKIPDRWKQDLPDPLPSDQMMRTVREALARHGVRYVDATEILQRSKVPRNDLWQPDARHWTVYGACLALNRAAVLYTELSGRRPPPHTCALAREGSQRNDDNDLLHVMNTMWVRPAYEPLVVVHHDEIAVPAADKPNTLIVATSFGWMLYFEAQDSGLYGPVHLNYYNVTFVPPEGAHYPVKTGTPEWQEAVMKKDYYVLDLFESYFAPGAYVETFLADLLAALDAEDAATRGR